MKTFTHEQVQEILRSAEEAPDYDRAGLADHLSECADCRSYAALVAELGQVVPGMIPVPFLSKQEIHRIVGTSQSRLRRQSMLIHDFARHAYGAVGRGFLGARAVPGPPFSTAASPTGQREPYSHPYPTIDRHGDACYPKTPRPEISALLKSSRWRPVPVGSTPKQGYTQDGKDQWPNLMSQIDRGTGAEVRTCRPIILPMCNARPPW